MRKSPDSERLKWLYERLYERYGPRGWWPVTPEEGGEPRYDGGPRNDTQRLEVTLGAILAQNTAWKGASCAVVNIYRAGWMDFSRLRDCSQEELAPLLRPSGYFNQKAGKIKNLIVFMDQRYGDRWTALYGETRETLRALLLAQSGIGPETADSIVLYAAGKPEFVIDAYTRRLLYRLGWGGEKESYESLKARFEAAIPRETKVYQEYHALLDRQCVERCRKRNPLCGECPLAGVCARRGLE